jgi:hypothetical protein
MAHRDARPAQLPAHLWNIDATVLLTNEWLPEAMFSRVCRARGSVCPIFIHGRTVFPSSLILKHPSWTFNNWLEQRWFLRADEREKYPQLSREWTYVIAHYSRAMGYDEVIPELWTIGLIFDKYWTRYGTATLKGTPDEIRAIIAELHAPIPRMPVTSTFAQPDLMESPIVRKIKHLTHFVDSFTNQLQEHIDKPKNSTETHP